MYRSEIIKFIALFFRSLFSSHGDLVMGNPSFMIKTHLIAVEYSIIKNDWHCLKTIYYVL